MNQTSSTHLKPHTRILVYGLTAMAALLLAYENYLYGLYELVYTALIVFVLCAAGSGLSWVQKRVNVREAVHGLILVATALLIVSDIPAHVREAKFSLYPLCLLSFLILPLRQAARFNTGLLVLASLVIWNYDNTFTAIAFAASYAMLGGIAMLYAWLHHHRSRSLVELSIHDAGTGAYNMRHFERTLDKEIHRADDSSLPLSIIALEVDYLDQFIALNGQHSGKALAAQLSEMLKGMIRAGDSHYYDGTRRFYLLLPNTPEEGVLVIAERIRRQAGEHGWQGIEHLTVSLGCSSLTSDTKDVQSLISEAQTALSEAQKNGHNRVSHFLH